MKTSLKGLLSSLSVAYPTLVVAKLLGAPVPALLVNGDVALSVFAILAITTLVVSEYSKPVDSLPLPAQPPRSGKSLVPFPTEVEPRRLAA